MDVFHLQSVTQIDVITSTLRDMLKCIVEDKLKQQGFGLEFHFEVAKSIDIRSSTDFYTTCGQLIEDIFDVILVHNKIFEGHE